VNAANFLVGARSGRVGYYTRILMLLKWLCNDVVLIQYA
tara:strand:- start:1444 stop:1560 length:117 start_codon:yes stop_codon:yes gene_type:complete